MPTSTDARDVMDDRVPQEPYAARPNYRYETTTDGDIVVHEQEPAYPPPPGVEGDMVDPSRPYPPPPPHHNHHAPIQLQHYQHPPSHHQQPPPSSSISWPSQELRKPSSLKRHGRHHSRNLSAHFFDATKISSADDDDEDEAQVDTTTYGKTSEVSSSVAGQKHRPMFSGDVSNPPLAHRRINSIGNAAAVDRFLQRPRGRHPKARPRPLPA